jgi:hypothetical protein
MPIKIEKKEFVEKCEQVYTKNKEILESQHKGKVVALYEDGIAGIGNDVDSAFKEATKKHPDKIFYFRNIGDSAVSGILF